MRTGKRFETGLIILALLAVTLLALPAGNVVAQGDEDDDLPIRVMMTIQGVIETIDDDAIVISGVSVMVDDDVEASALVDGQEFIIAPAGAFRPAILKVGDLVEITGYLLNDDTFKATSLVILEEAEEDETQDQEDLDQEEMDDPEDEQDEDLESGCLPADHPVALALSEGMDVPYEDIVAWSCEGYGLGAIARALLIAEAAEGAYTADELLAMSKELGWGEVLKEAGIHPGSLAPGRVISEQKRNNNKPDVPRGNSANAPGQSNRPGNSGNAPGHNKGQ